MPATTIKSRFDLNFSRSEGDLKGYRLLITLQNGLECLVVSSFSEQTFELSKRLSSTPQQQIGD
jgi:hypothetical protein